MKSATDLQSGTMTQRLTERLRADILAGSFKPGQRLKIMAVSQRYDVSPIPVREALRLLAGQGLVELQPHRGAVIRKVGADYVRNMFDIRMALETMLVERALERITAEDLSRIQSAERDYAAAAESRNVEAVLSTNAAFHGAITALAENEEAEKMAPRGWELIRAVRLTIGFDHERAAANIRDHAEIVAALAGRDSGAAVAAARKHCLNCRDYLMAELRRRDLSEG